MRDTPNFNELDAAALEYAAGICTAKQMEVLRLRSEGLGHRAIARRLLITPSSSKERLDAALLHLRKDIIKREREGSE